MPRPTEDARAAGAVPVACVLDPERLAARVEGAAPPLQVHSIETFGTRDGPGIRLVLFLQGCALRCLYCHNPDTQPVVAPGEAAPPAISDDPARRPWSVREVLERLERERPYFGRQGGLTVSGGEPTLQAQALVALFSAARERRFHLALDTSGAIWSRTVNRLYDLTDLVILDLKHIDDAWHRRLTGAGNRNTLRNAEYRERSGKPMWLRYVLVPGFSDQSEYLRAWARHFSGWRSVERVELIPYHTLGVHKYAALGLRYELEGVAPPSPEAVERARELLAERLGGVVVV